MRLPLVGLLVGCIGCAHNAPVVRQYDFCRATDVTAVQDRSGVGTWKAKCVNQWELRQQVTFNRPIQNGDVILYIPFKENDGGELHGYIHTINGRE